MPRFLSTWASWPSRFSRTPSFETSQEHGELELKSSRSVKVVLNQSRRTRTARKTDRMFKVSFRRLQRNPSKERHKKALMTWSSSFWREDEARPAKIVKLLMFCLFDIYQAHSQCRIGHTWQIKLRMHACLYSVRFIFSRRKDDTHKTKRAKHTRQREPSMHLPCLYSIYDDQ